MPTVDLLSMSLTGAAMALAVVVARALLLKRLPKTTFVVLWMLVALRLLVPVAMPMPVNAYSLLEKPAQAVAEKVGTLFGQADTGSTAAPESTGDTNALTQASGSTASEATAAMGDDAAMQGSMATASESAPSSTAWNSSATANVQADTPVKPESRKLPVVPWNTLWAAGTGICVSGFVLSYLRSKNRFASSLPVTDKRMLALFSEACKETGALQVVELRQSDEIPVPLTYGVLHPVVLIPKTCLHAEVMGDAQTRFVLAHELCHVRRHDVALKFALAAAVCLHWFNPMAWIMWVLAMRDIELACDETVVRLLGRNDPGTTRARYARALISMEESKSGLAPLTLCSAFNKTAIEERIVAIMNIRKTTCAAFIASSLLIVGVPAAFASTTCWGLPNGGSAYQYTFNPADIESSTDADVETTEVASETPFSSATEDTADQIGAETVEGRFSIDGAAQSGDTATSTDEEATRVEIPYGGSVSASQVIDNYLITSVAASDDSTAVEVTSEGNLQADKVTAFLDTLKGFGLDWEIATETYDEGTVQNTLVITYKGQAVHAIYDPQSGTLIASGEGDYMHGKNTGVDAVDLVVAHDKVSNKPTGLDISPTLDDDVVNGTVPVTSWSTFVPQQAGDLATEETSLDAAAEQVTDVSEMPETSTAELISLFEPYAKFGLSYNPQSGAVAYTNPSGSNTEPQVVSNFTDVKSMAKDAKGEAVGNVFTYSDGTDRGISLRAVRDSSGMLIGLEVEENQG